MRLFLHNCHHRDMCDVRYASREEGLGTRFKCLNDAMDTEKLSSDTQWWHMFRYDSDVDDNDRVQIFATQGNTEVLRPSGHWFMNGTLRLFQRYLTSFTQFLHCRQTQSFHVFMLCIKQTWETYRGPLRQLQEIDQEPPKFNFDRLWTRSCISYSRNIPADCGPGLLLPPCPECLAKSTRYWLFTGVQRWRLFFY